MLEERRIMKVNIEDWELKVMLGKEVVWVLIALNVNSHGAESTGCYRFSKLACGEESIKTIFPVKHRSKN